LKQEFVNLIEQNMQVMGWFGDHMKRHGASAPLKDILRHGHQQLHVLNHLYLKGGALLKDIARREEMSSANLCAAFRKLELGGLVVRSVDDSDRRNVRYAVSDAGAAVAKTVLGYVRGRIAAFFDGLNPEDGRKLVSALGTINEILTRRKEEILNDGD
jgi:DNA-binding MarR family transcriptional regulator